MLKWTVRTEPTGNLLADLHTTAFAKVAHLYDHQDPHLLQTYQTRANQIAPLFSADRRRRLVAALRPYLQEIDASAAAFDQLDRLLDERTVAIVTGQQAGLFTGPFYTIYKALSAIGLAQRLDRDLGRPVVPVFWVASEDHDWAEVNHAYFLDRSDALQKIQWPHDPQAHQMVFHHPLAEIDVDQVIQDVFRLLPDGPLKAETLRMFRNTWHSGDSLSTWFARVMAELFRHSGLVLLDPCLPALRDLVAPVWHRALEGVPEAQQALEQAYDEVRALGAEPAVIRDRENTTMFYIMDGKRFVLETDGPGRLRVRGVGLSKPVAQWQRLAEETPHAFSSNVLLRPVVQDHLVPTLAYVGGPSEIAYHPLSRAVFHTHGRTLPPLLLRQRMTWYPASVLRNLAKWKIDVSALLTPTDLVTAHLNDLGFARIDAAFEGIREETVRRWDIFATQIDDLGPQVQTMARAQADRERAGIRKLETKVRRLFEQRHAAALQQLRQIERWLWTDGHPQERRLSPLNVLIRHGAAWVQQLPAWGDYPNVGAVYHVEDVVEDIVQERVDGVKN